MAKSERQADPADTRCPVCAAGAERGQLICLECGSRIALRHRRPPSWKVPVAIVIGVLVLASAGGVLAYEALDADARREADAAPPRVADPAEDADEGAGSAEPDESDSEESESQDSAEREPSLGGDAAGDDVPATPDEAPAETPAVPAGELVPDGDLFTWPRTLQGFTVVVQSTEDRGSATTFARSVAESSDGQVGVISSADFETIPQGFFVVFVGRYDGRPDAERAAVRLGRTYPGAFPQAVRR